MEKMIKFLKNQILPKSKILKNYIFINKNLKKKILINQNDKFFPKLLLTLAFSNHEACSAKYLKAW